MVRLYALIVIFMALVTVLGRVCRPEDLGTACPHELRLGCVCYKNGRCVEREASLCGDCSNPDVYSVDYGRCK